MNPEVKSSHLPVLNRKDLRPYLGAGNFPPKCHNGNNQEKDAPASARAAFSKNGLFKGKNGLSEHENGPFGQSAANGNTRMDIDDSAHLTLEKARIFDTLLFAFYSPRDIRTIPAAPEPSSRCRPPG